MKRIFSHILFFALLGTTACQAGLNGTGTSAGGDVGLNAGASPASEVNAHAVERPASFAQTDFSEFIYIDSDDQKLLMNWNFFPSTQYDSQAKTLTLPCDVEHQTTTAEGVTYSESVAIGDVSCTTGVVLDLSEATFETYGLVFAFSSTLDVLEEDFEITITTNGFKISQGEILTFESIDGKGVDLVHVLSTL